jgi:hypothetical protein
MSIRQRVVAGIRGVRPSPWRDGLLLVGALVGLAQALGIGPRPFDAGFYWDPPLSHLYPDHWIDGGYPYPPPLAVALGPLHVFGWAAFQVGWATLQFGALWVMARRWAWLVLAAGAFYLVTPIGFFEIPGRGLLGYAVMGNVQLLLGAAIVLALRWPALWSIPLLTKVGPGIGVVWHVFRREWRELGIALAATATVALVSLIVAPDTWAQWLTFIQSNTASDTGLPVIAIAFPIRVAMSVALLAWGAPRGSTWVVPLAAGWALPALYAGSEWAIWLGVVALIGRRAPRTRPIWAMAPGRARTPQLVGP